ncbi:MAG: helix-turn-helix domain-containing protein [Candidatus Thermoplasmatota archaeon]|nr:helix-turn-helix domain-containing protein [Candidatus Thermoplasmatota archaeon]
MKKSKKEKIDKEILSLSKIINALNNKNRLTLLGLLYIDNMKSFTDIANEIKIESNKLSYHLNVLINSKLVFKKNDEYILTNDGEKILMDIGFVEEIKELIEPKQKEKQLVENKITYQDASSSDLIIRKLERMQERAKSINDYSPQLNQFVDYFAFTTEKEIQDYMGYLKNKTFVDPEIYKSLKLFSIKINDEIYLKNPKK